MKNFCTKNIFLSLLAFATLQISFAPSMLFSMNSEQQLFYDACDQGNMLAAERLLYENENYLDLVNCCDSRGNTPLHVAARQDNLPLISLLIENGAPLEKKNKNGATPFLFTHTLLVDKPEKLKTLQMFIKYGATIDSTANDGFNVALASVFLSDIEMTRELIKNGANTNLSNSLQDESKHCVASALLEESTALNAYERAKTTYESRQQIKNIDKIEDWITQQYKKAEYDYELAKKKREASQAIDKMLN